MVYTLVHWLDDEVFEQCPTWEDCERSEIFFRPLLETFFGPFDLNKTGPAAYAKSVQTGVGRYVIAKMLEGTEKEGAIKQGRAFFDSWLERFSTWDLLVQGVRSDPLPEFGQSADIAIIQVTGWLGGAAEAPNNYANIVKYGVGATILHRFTGIPKSTIEASFSPRAQGCHGKRLFRLEQTKFHPACAGVPLCHLWA